ncbi:MAG: hypothetical protein LC633_05845 [Desulfobulbaceae bacterium]|nr:hypothetical protein [Desulfobulbaceae bacterium]
MREKHGGSGPSARREKIKRYRPYLLNWAKAGLSYVIIVPILFAVPGCALLDYSERADRQGREAKLERLVAAREYHAARRLLEQMTPAGAGEEYESRRRRLSRLAGEYVSEIEHNATVRLREDDLFAAIVMVEQALGKIPENEELLRFRAELHQERDRRLAANERKMLADEAEYLYSRIQGYARMAELEKLSSGTRRRIHKMEETLVKLHPALIACGRQALELEDYEVAGRCLAAAGKIDDSDQAVMQLKERLATTEAAGMGEGGGAETGLVYIAQSSKVKSAEAREVSFRTLEEQLKLAIGNGELVEAEKIQAELEKFSGRDEVLAEYRRQLDQARERRIAEQMESGSELYRAGRIKEARAVWRQILILDPDNRLAGEKIARADKVLASIRDLKKAQK